MKLKRKIQINIGKPVHLHRQTNWTECGVQSPLRSLDIKEIDCLRCQKTKAYKKLKNQTYAGRRPPPYEGMDRQDMEDMAQWMDIPNQ